MNTTFKKNHIRILSLAMVICMLLTLFAGCRKDDPKNDKVPESPPGLVTVDPSTEPTEAEPTETEPINEDLAIVKEQVNVRSAPSTTSIIIGTLDAGTEVEIIQQEAALGIEWGRTSDGWIPMDSVEWKYERKEDPKPVETTPEETKPQETTTNTKGVITATQLYIRKDAKQTAEAVGKYVKGDVITILEVKGDWGRTDKGWISMKYVSTSAETTNNDPDNKDNKDNKDDTTANGKGKKAVITGSELNIRKEGSANSERVGSYKYGDRVEILESKNGWGRTDKGWVSLDYVYIDGTTGKNTAKGVVTGSKVNVRSGPGTGHDSVATVSFGDRVEILEQIKYNNTTWGCTKDGWISMQYVYVDGTTAEGSGTGTITGSQLNIRSGPGTAYGSVGSLNKGDKVKIFAQIKLGDMTWGCTEKGWISMKYVEMD